MMQPLADTSNPTPNLQKFLDLIDRVTAATGKDVPAIVNIEQLRSLPPGTFGRSWADFLDTHQIPPFTTGPRRKQLHDGVHVLTGYGTDPINEAELQAFLLGAKLQLANMLLGLGLLRVIHRNLNYLQQFSWDRLWRAYQRGCQSQFDPDTWQPELLWHLPLAEVQKIFVITPN
ncbi:Coq4 family protein [Nostoc sp. CENA543]|uniref:Coq4 family protein n=1 Tax=Nostoc sp. CENA543 TaxID=1869241 RepID=UPI001CEF8449|nr:Coq4 family protein [Nostoc sp. CENA543]